jgi:protein-S-isoprenylcysteine O-methyltransferase Ste14
MLVSCVSETGRADFLCRNGRGTREMSAPHLVTGGWYAVVRHPLYLFSILFLVLNPVMTGQWLLLTILSTIYFVIGALIEEKRLVRLFGDEYRRYQREVPFIIPCPKRLRRPQRRN